MRRILFAAAILCCAPVFALATLIEVPLDDYAIWPQAGGDVLQTATAPHPNEDVVVLVWTLDAGTGPRDVLAGVIDANVPTGGALVGVNTPADFVRDPAAAFDMGTGQWLIVWAQEESPGAYEIYGRLMFADGTLNPAPIRITTTGVTDADPAFDALQPAVSSNEAGTFLVAWAADDDVYTLPDGGFEVFYRTLDARDETLGPVVQFSSFAAGGSGGAATQPELGYLYSTDSWMLAYEGDLTADPNVYAPLMYANLVPASGLPRTDAQPQLAVPQAARRLTASWRNPSVAIDRLNQQVLLIWDESNAGDVVARRVRGVRYDNMRGILDIPIFRDLNVEGHGPQSYVRDPAVTHNRISGSYVLAWRESLNPADGTGQTLMAVEFDEVVGPTSLPFPFVNQGVVGPLPTEFGPPVIEGGWRNNGRVFSAFVADKDVKGELWLYGQGFDTQAATAAPPGVIPTKFAVSVAPNPFNPRTSIELALPIAGRARVDIYDVRGRLVRQLVDEDLPAGDYSRTWAGLDDRGQRVASGVYMVKVHHPGGERVTKVALVE